VFGPEDILDDISVLDSFLELYFFIQLFNLFVFLSFDLLFLNPLNPDIFGIFGHVMGHLNGLGSFPPQLLIFGLHLGVLLLVEFDLAHVKDVFLFQQFFSLFILLNLAGYEIALFIELFLFFELRNQDIGLLVNHFALLSFFLVFFHSLFDQLSLLLLETSFELLSLLFLFLLFSLPLLKLLFLHFPFLLLDFHFL
jgi:hypothetical protein